MRPATNSTFPQPPLDSLATPISSQIRLFYRLLIGICRYFWLYLNLACAETAIFELPIKIEASDFHSRKETNNSAIRMRFRVFVAVQIKNLPHFYLIYLKFNQNMPDCRSVCTVNECLKTSYDRLFVYLLSFRKSQSLNMF